MTTLSRRAFLSTIGLAALSGMLAACGAGVSAAEARSNQPREKSPQISPDDVRSYAAGHNQFGFDLYRLMDAGNLFFSPYSIAQVFTMTSAGARGQTALQMAQTLHSTLPDDRLHSAANALDQALNNRGSGDDAFQLETANSLWGQQGMTFQPAFLDTLAINYGAGLELLDFKTAPDTARTSINTAIAKQTHDNIQDLLPSGSIDTNTRLVLANAIYFNAKWQIPFEKESTHDDTFQTADGESVTTPMMSHQASYPYAEGEEYQAISLAYRGGVSLVALLPAEGQLSALEADLNAEQLQHIVDSLAPRPVLLSLPKFEYHSTSISLKQKLQALGMTDAFDPSAADFSGMDGQRDVCIGDGIHKAMVRIDEEGTEAAAATAVNMVTTSAPVDPPLVLSFNRPFIFLIRDDETGTLLFMGRVSNPQAH